MTAVAATAAVTTGCGSTDPLPRPVPSPTTSVIGSGRGVTDLDHGAQLRSWTLAGRRGAPWLLYVHGGSWRSGRADSPTAAMFAARLLPRGYQVFSVEYRLSGVAPWPAQRVDVAAAVDRIRAEAARYGIAPGRGVLVGESAGGQLASVEGMRGRVAGVVSLAGVADPLAVLSAPFRPLRRATEQFVGCAPTLCPSRWQDTRAVAHLAAGARTPPFLVIHCERDPVVPVSMSRELATALRAAGRPVTLRVERGADHKVLLRPGVLTRVLAFADQVTAAG